MSHVRNPTDYVRMVALGDTAEIVSGTDAQIVLGLSHFQRILWLFIDIVTKGNDLAFGFILQILLNRDNAVPIVEKSVD